MTEASKAKTVNLGLPLTAKHHVINTPDTESAYTIEATANISGVVGGGAMSGPMEPGAPVVAEGVEVTSLHFDSLEGMSVRRRDDGMRVCTGTFYPQSQTFNFEGVETTAEKSAIMEAVEAFAADVKAEVEATR